MTVSVIARNPDHSGDEAISLFYLENRITTECRVRKIGPLYRKTSNYN